MTPRGSLLILAVVAQLGGPHASWGAEPAAGQDYYSVQLLSARSAAALQPALVLVAQQPHARIDKHGAEYALRVGFWASRAEAEQALAALRPTFRVAYVRTATYRPDSMVLAVEPAPATSAPRPATPAASPPAQESAQSQVLSVRRAEQQNLLRDPELQPAKPAAAPVERPRARAQPRSASTPDEAPLWRLLREERYAELDSALARLRRAHPAWSPPARLLALKQDAETRARITEAIAGKDWNTVVGIAQRHPAAFACDQITFLWGLAEAYHALGKAEQALATYQRIIPSCPKTADRIATLQKANALLGAEASADLLKREQQAGQRNAEQQAQFDQVTYDYHLRQFLQAVETKDLARAIGLIGNLEAALKARRDARSAALVGWVYFDAGQAEIAATWFGTALAWEPALDDARYGLALANFRLKRLNDAEAALRQADPDRPRNRALLGDIAFARALEAYDGKQYRQSLELLKQAEGHGKTGRDVVLLSAWNRYHLGEHAEAALLFIGLYRAQLDKESAEGAVFSLALSQRWDELAELAQSLGGPLKERWQAAVAQRDYYRKLFLAAEAQAPGHFPQLHNIAGSNIALGAMVRDKSGDDGTSRLRLTKAPYMEGVAVFRITHELGLQLYRVDLDSRDLPANAMVGSFPAAGGYVTTPTTRLRNSLEPHLSYRHQGWLTTYAGIGLTPSGAVLSSAPIGNLGVIQQHERGNWRAELFSQPVRESILSYTGIVDPYSGQSWGRVRKSGALVDGYAALSERWGVSAKLQAMHLDGRNVASNQALALNLSLARDLRLRGFDYFTVGPDLSYETYERNLSHFTLGHGGYFSPERLISLGVSSHFLTEEARQHIVKGDVSLGLFNKSEAASPCFPLGAVLPLNPACQNGYGASRDSGVYFSAQFFTVRRLSDHLQLGGGVVLRQNPQYDDISLMVFLRYLISPRKVVMSSDIPEQVFQSLY